MRRAIPTLTVLLLAGTAQARDAGSGSLPAPGLTAAQMAKLAASPSAYLGEVATRAAIPNGFNASLHQFNAESFHILRDDVTAIRIIVPNFWVNVSAAAGTSEETSTGAAATVTESLEYPVGTFKQFLFSGIVQGTVANGGILMSDALPVSMRNGVRFGLREFYQNSAGVPYRNSSAGGVFTQDVAQFAGSGLSDLTMGGTITEFSKSVAEFPVAILAMTGKGAVCEISDSRVEGVQDARTDSTNDGGEVNRFIGPRAAYLELGSYGEYAVKFAASDPIRKQLMRYCRIAIDQLGINDLTGGTTVAATEAARVALDAQFAAYGGKVYGVTLTPYTGSSDGWATAANQVTTNIEGEREQVNADIRNGLAGESGLIDVDKMIDPTQSHLWPVNGTASAYTPDGVHETTLGAMTELQSGLWNGVAIP